jgi:uncharacterized protein (TIGR02284 family)
MATDSTITALNQLLEVCRDGEMGFASAAEHVQDAGTKWMFQEIARRRGQFADELKQEIRRLGGAPHEGGSLAGTVHRHWMDVKHALRGRNDAAIMAEAARGEETAVGAYANAVQASLPPPTRAIVERQQTDVRDTHDRVRALEQEWRHRR